MKAHIVPATLEAAFVLAQSMRPADVAELEVCGLTPLEGLLQSMKVSEFSYSVLYDDVVGAMFGVAPLDDSPVLGHADQVWFLTGHLFGQKPVAFTKAMKDACRALLERYPRLVNAIDARYAGALRLAEVAFGAKFGPPVPFGRNGEPFIPFVIERN